MKFGDDAFLKLEAEMAKKFSRRPRSFVTSSTSGIFNGAKISYGNGSYIIFQGDHIGRLSKISTDSSLSCYVTFRAREAYFASVSRPDLTFGFSACSQFSLTTFQEIQLSNETIQLAHDHPRRSAVCVFAN